MQSVNIFIVSVILITSCADLRTKTTKKDPAVDKARQLLLEMGKAHGIENWENFNTYTVYFEDEFFGKIGKKSMPYPETPNKFELSCIPKSFDGRMNFVSGSWTGKTWGIQAWETYTFDEQGNAIFEKNKDAYFWIPTYQYFIEFPLRIQEATAVAYAGEREIEGIRCEGVIASWETVKPQKNTDQYLIWINAKTKRIHKLEYTIREYASFLKGAVYFKNYVDYGGILLPSLLPVESNLVKGGFLHEMSITNFRPDIYSIDELRPNSDLDAFGDKKPK